MAEYTAAQLKKILENHQHWIREDRDGWCSMRANLCGANLRVADLCGVDLYGADLRGATLRDANLRDANLRGANLRGADLCGATLRDANLRDADLRDANLRDTDLCGVDLRGAKNVPFIAMACPDTGSFTAWKKCIGGTIVKILIPADARRLSATGRKCRADKAIVLEIQDKDGNVLDKDTVYSLHDGNFAYTVGETVTPRNPFCEDRWDECSSGIHFYINREDAVDN